MSSYTHTSFLASVLCDARAGAPSSESTFRRYGATVQSSTTIAGNRDTKMSTIVYEVGAASFRLKTLLGRRSDGAPRVECAYRCSSVLSEEFIGLAKKYTNFSATFDFGSLAAVAERLAKGLASCSLFPEITSSDLRGGNPLRLQALGTYDGPINSLATHVFVPRLVNKVIGGDTFAVLANAICGEGGSVVTDVLELDAVTRQPIIGTVDGTSLAQGIVEALRVVGANMIASDQGPLFALAVTRGIHKTVTVVGHTDEGGIVRDLLRCSDFATPFGGIHCGLEPYAGIPALATNGAADVSAYVDSLALVTAAAVAHCDPGLLVCGNWFPFSIEGTAPMTPETAPGTSLPGTADMGVRNRSQLLAAITPFWYAYCGALGKIFGAAGDPGHASTVATAMSVSLAPSPRHLCYPSVCPFFWIEPTSLIPHDFLGSDAERFGCGAFATPHEPRSKLAWEDIVQVGGGDIATGGYVVRCKSARSSWFLAHWNGHPDNGLSCVGVRQLDPNVVVHPGASPIGDVGARVLAGAPIASFLWERGQSPFCAPGEFMNLNSTMGIFVRHCTYDNDGFPHREHVPSVREFAGCTVEIFVGKPFGLASGPTNAAPRTAQRARTRATRELASAAERVRVFGRADTSAMMIMTSTPVFPGSQNVSAPFETRGHAAPGGTSGWTRSPVGGPHPDNVDREAQGEPNQPVAQHQPLRAPQLGRSLAVGTGGGGAPLPSSATVDPASTSSDVPVAPTGAALPEGPNVQ